MTWSHYCNIAVFVLVGMLKGCRVKVSVWECQYGCHGPLVLQGMESKPTGCMYHRVSTLALKSSDSHIRGSGRQRFVGSLVPESLRPCAYSTIVCPCDV